MNDLTTTAFTHILLTAPTESIAEVYRVQLSILRDTVPFLRGAQVNCVSDPSGQRVGSGGGTLNGLAFIRKTYDLNSFESVRVLIIHSGGESRRAPLYSLCGKAWTTINASIPGGEIATPIALLITELSLFCVNLQLGSLVVASSDVMLDILNIGSKSVDFVNDSVTLATVPANPTVAKNHGVILASTEDILGVGYAEGDVIVGQALNYLQKPSVTDMEKIGAVYTMASFIPATQSEPIDSKTFALVDTGVVIFTGAALTGLVTLLLDPVVSGCIAKELKATSDSESTATDNESTLRLELYSDLLLALSFLRQQDFELPVFLSRLGVNTLNNSLESSAYERALPVIWETLKNIPLQMIFVPSGKFEHLGTTAEVLKLLTNCTAEVARCDDPEASNTTDSSEDIIPTADVLSPSPVSSKLQRFAQKYGLQRTVRSRVTPAPTRVVAINSVVSVLPDPPSRDPEEGSGISEVLIEHSLLNNVFSIPHSAVVSHVCASLGQGLVVQDGIMLQQIFLQSARSSRSADVSLIPFTLLVLGIRDDMKVSFTDPESTVCGSSWQKLFEVAEVDRKDIWDESVPATERCLWTARLFCDSQLDHSGAVHIFSEGSLLPTDRLTLTWLQDLPRLGLELSEEYALAVRQWVGARRLSLADILSRGDATRMMLWRLWLQTAHRENYGVAGRVSRARGDYQMTVDLSLAFQYLLEFGQSLGGSERDAESGHTVLLSRWLVQLVQQVPDASFQRFFSQVLSLNNPSIHHVVSAYLKKLVLSDMDVGAVLWQLFNSVPRVAAHMHSRVLFLAAWLVKDRQYRANPELFSEISKSISTLHQLITLSAVRASPGEFESQLKTHGEEILRSAGAAALASVSHAQERNADEEDLSLAMERLAQGMVAFHLQTSLNAQSTQLVQQLNDSAEEAQHLTGEVVFTPKWKVSVKSQAPARIDLAGGWSDTPPICYELSGAVLNVGVLVDNTHPIRCFSNMISKPVLELHCQSLVGGEYEIEKLYTDQITDFADLTHSAQNQSCLLLRAVLVALGVIGTMDGWGGPSLRNHLQAKLGGGISVTCVSDLPAGSGLGGSSILAATALHSLSALLGLPTSQEALVSLVSQVEQILTTGGGWQDQVGSIFGGFKLGQSAARLPLGVSVDKLVTSHSFNEAFHRRTWLVYTGQQRLARNTLINALRYSALSPPVASTARANGCPGTVRALVDGAHAGWALLQSSVEEATEETAEDQMDQLSEVLNNYWELKKEMAAGSEPPHIATLLDQLRPLCSGLSLCGAGAGGFATVVLKRDVRESVLRELINSINLSQGERVVESEQLSVHSVTVDWIGIQSEDVAMA